MGWVSSHGERAPWGAQRAAARNKSSSGWPPDGRNPTPTARIARSGPLPSTPHSSPRRCPGAAISKNTAFLSYLFHEGGQQRPAYELEFLRQPPKITATSGNPRPAADARTPPGPVTGPPGPPRRDGRTQPHTVSPDPAWNFKNRSAAALLEAWNRETLSRSPPGRAPGSCGWGQDVEPAVASSREMGFQAASRSNEPRRARSPGSQPLS